MIKIKSEFLSVHEIQGVWVGNLLHFNLLLAWLTIQVISIIKIQCAQCWADWLPLHPFPHRCRWTNRLGSVQICEHCSIPTPHISNHQIPSWRAKHFRMGLNFLLEWASRVGDGKRESIGCPEQSSPVIPYPKRTENGEGNVNFPTILESNYPWNHRHIPSPIGYWMHDNNWPHYAKIQAIDESRWSHLLCPSAACWYGSSEIGHLTEKEAWNK